MMKRLFKHLFPILLLGLAAILLLTACQTPPPPTDTTADNCLRNERILKYHCERFGYDGYSTTYYNKTA